MLILEEELPKVKLPSTTEVAEVLEVGNDLKIYPFPAEETVNIEYLDSRFFKFQVINSQGQQVLQGESLDGHLKIERHEINSGIYWIRTIDNSGKVLSKPLQFH
jgi:hypothetical protein